MTIHRPILARLLKNPGRIAVVDDRRSYKAYEILAASFHAASVIKKACKTPNVGLLIPTSGAFPITALGAWSVGKTIVPLNYLLKPAELQYVIDDCETDTIVASKLMLDFLGEKPKVKNLILLEDIDFKKPPIPRWPAGAADNDTAALVYTSGTSGKPKGVMLSHRAIRENACQGVNHFNFRSGEDVMCGVLPQFHSYGLTQLTITPLLHGMKVVYTARFVPKKVMSLVQEHGATILVGIPTMYNALARLKGGGPETVKTLRLAVSGSEPLPQAVFDLFESKYGMPIVEGYGMTEMSPATHASLPETNKRGTVGAPLPKIEQRIIDPATERELPPNQDGEVRLKGPNLMTGYFKLDEQTKAAIDDEGFYRTGDMGRIDDDGMLSITGRIKEMMIIGGENVFPREIEEVLNRHPSINASGVIGQQDDMRGEVPVAFVELCPELKEAEGDEAFDERALIAYCREHLAGYKCPRSIFLLDELPRNPTGKILRKELKPLLEARTSEASSQPT